MRNEEKMGERIKGELVEIDINKKYALLVKDKLSDPEYYELLHRIEIFLKSDKPIMVIDGSRVELIDLSENE